MGSTLSRHIDAVCAKLASGIFFLRQSNCRFVAQLGTNDGILWLNICPFSLRVIFVLTLRKFEVLESP